MKLLEVVVEVDNFEEISQLFKNEELLIQKLVEFKFLNLIEKYDLDFAAAQFLNQFVSLNDWLQQEY